MILKFNNPMGTIPFDCSKLRGLSNNLIPFPDSQAPLNQLQYNSGNEPHVIPLPKIVDGRANL
jgi:hypothetical protein